jgi:polyisoprenoid-binding protein YceI
MNRSVKRGLIAIPVLIALAFGAILIYANFINDPPDRLSEAQLSERVAEAATSPSTDGTDPPSGASVDGTWNVTEESEFGYRVEEVLFGINTTAAGRSNQISGSMSIDGTTVTDASFTVDVGSITSDETRRDSQFRGRIMQVDQFPEATFTLGAPIEFGTVPVAGDQITASATGDLTLHGVTRSVTFDVTAEAGANRIGVLGNIPVRFADYDIDNPSIGGVTTEETGLLEFILVFEPA